jgi:phosphate-selective porin OprO/OprP
MVKMGRYGRTKILRPLDPDKGQWGAVEIAARYSRVNLNRMDKRYKLPLQPAPDVIYAQGGEMWDIAAGLNWYLYDNLRFLANYIYSKDIDVLGKGIDGFAHVGQIRAQLDF